LSREIRRHKNGGCVANNVDDLDKLAPLILKCYETEAAKH
jgi:hypothetical protein